MARAAFAQCLYQVSCAGQTVQKLKWRKRDRQTQTTWLSSLLIFLLILLLFLVFFFVVVRKESGLQITSFRSLQGHNFHTKIRKDPSTGSPVEACERSDGQGCP